MALGGLVEKESRDIGRLGWEGVSLHRKVWLGRSASHRKGWLGRSALDRKGWLGRSVLASKGVIGKEKRKRERKREKGGREGEEREKREERSLLGKEEVYHQKGLLGKEEGRGIGRVWLGERRAAGERSGLEEGGGGLCVAMASRRLGWAKEGAFSHLVVQRWVHLIVAF